MLLLLGTWDPMQGDAIEQLNVGLTVFSRVPADDRPIAKQIDVAVPTFVETVWNGAQK